MSNFRTGWYLIYTKPHQERKVANQLSEMNIQSYLPLKLERRKWSDRIKIIHSPIFPSYVFVQLKSVQEFFDGLSAEGSCCYVKFGNEAARMREDEIEAIRMIETNGENIEIADNSFQIGQHLVIQHGPLNGFPCEVIQYKGRKRILVRVAILQRSIMADLPYTAFSQHG